MSFSSWKWERRPRRSSPISKKRKPFLRYLQDRGCGDRWDRSTSHRKQKPKQNQNCLTVTVTRNTLSKSKPRYIPDLGTSGNSRYTPGDPGADADRAILAEARPADGRDVRLRTLRWVLHCRLSVSEGFLRRILGTSWTPEGRSQLRTDSRNHAIDASRRVKRKRFRITARIHWNWPRDSARRASPCRTGVTSPHDGRSAARWTAASRHNDDGEDNEEREWHPSRRGYEGNGNARQHIPFGGDGATERAQGTRERLSPPYLPERLRRRWRFPPLHRRASCSVVLGFPRPRAHRRASKRPRQATRPPHPAPNFKLVKDALSSRSRCCGAASPSSGRVNALRGIFVAPDSNVVSPLAIALFLRDQVRIALGEFLAAIRITQSKLSDNPSRADSLYLKWERNSGYRC